MQFKSVSDSVFLYLSWLYCPHQLLIYHHRSQVHTPTKQGWCWFSWLGYHLVAVQHVRWADLGSRDSISGCNGASYLCGACDRSCRLYHPVT